MTAPCSVGSGAFRTDLPLPLEDAGVAYCTALLDRFGLVCDQLMPAAAGQHDFGTSLGASELLYALAIFALSVAVGGRYDARRPVNLLIEWSSDLPVSSLRA